MPYVVPIPLAGFTTELGSTAERIRAIEAERLGNPTATKTGTTTFPSILSVWTAPTGFPVLDVAFPAGNAGGIIVAGGTQMSGPTANVTIGVSIDSAAPLTSSFATSVTSGYNSGITLVQWTGVMDLGFHNFTFEVKTNGANAQLNGPTLSVIVF